MDGKSTSTAAIGGGQTEHIQKTADSACEVAGDAPATLHQAAMSADETLDAESDNKMLLDQEPNDATPSGAIKLTPANNNDDEVVRMEMSPANEATARADPISKGHTNKATVGQDSRPRMSLSGTYSNDQNTNQGGDISSMPTNQQQENKQPMEQQIALTDSDLNTRSGSNETTRKTSTAAHEFARGQEGDSIKENPDNHNKLVRQASTPRESGSQKDIGKAADQQQPQQQQPGNSSPIQARNLRSSQSKQIVESAMFPDRSSKLSWCCCCPCSR